MNIELLKEKLIYLFKWMIHQGYVIFPILYILYALVLNKAINVSILLFWLGTGALGHFAFVAWRKHDLADDEIDIQPQQKHEDSEARINWKGIKQTLVSLSLSEICHWILTIAFLFLTWWAMLQGLGLLFVETGDSDWYTMLFSTIVTLTLFWLVLMITKRKNMIALILFYLLFDMLSAFMFNFVHFYDNISFTQKMDSDMQSCMTYMDIQRNKVSLLAQEIGTKYGEVKAAEEKQTRELNRKRNNIDLNIQTYEKRRNDIEQTLSSTRDSIQRASLLNDRRRITQNIQNLEKEKEKLIYKTIEIRNMVEWNNLKVFADTLVHTKDELDRLCNHYTDNAINQSFGLEELNRSKDKVNEIQALIENLSNDKLLASHHINMPNDTISYILQKIQSRGSDRFASLNNLFGAVGELFDTAKEKEEKELALAQKYNQNPTLIAFHKEEKSFENRLLFLSIAMSILIDLLPLALGIFVALGKAKQTWSFATIGAVFFIIACFLLH